MVDGFDKMVRVRRATDAETIEGDLPLGCVVVEDDSFEMVLPPGQAARLGSALIAFAGADDQQVA